MSSDESRWGFESRIDPTSLQIGHFVTQLDKPWSETDLPFQGVLIDSEEKRAWMVDNCAWVVISHIRSPNKSRPARILPSGKRPNNHGPSPKRRLHTLSLGAVTRETLDAALKVYDSLDDQVKVLASQFKQQGRINMDSAQEVVRELSGVLEHNLAALVWLTRIKECDNYTAQHCINVSILAIGLAHALNWSRRQVEHAGLAGLLHDLGKTMVDQSVLNKPGRLSAEEFEEIKRHTSFGYEMLSKDGNLPKEVAEAVLCHHERPDGSGYPRGLRKPEIPNLARLVAIVDAYDAITSHRIYDPARSHHEALGILWRERNRQFDGPMVEMFTQFLGWVTPGTLVRLTNGRLAVVLQAKDGRGLLPLVRLLEQEEKSLRLGEKVDLATLRPKMGDAPIRIAEVLPDGAEGVDIRALSLEF